MKLLTLEQIILLHRRILQQSGGGEGVRDAGILESAIAQPKMSYRGELLYPSLIDKVAALGFSLIKNHPFVDGNKSRFPAWYIPKMRIAFPLKTFSFILEKKCKFKINIIILKLIL